MKLPQPHTTPEGTEERQVNNPRTSEKSMREGKEKKRKNSRMNEFCIISKCPSIQDAIGSDRRVFGIGAQHGKNVDSCRYQPMRVIPVPVPNKAVNTTEGSE